MQVQNIIKTIQMGNYKEQHSPFHDPTDPASTVAQEDVEVGALVGVED